MKSYEKIGKKGEKTQIIKKPIAKKSRQGDTSAREKFLQQFYFFQQANLWSYEENFHHLTTQSLSINFMFDEIQNKLERL